MPVSIPDFASLGSETPQPSTTLGRFNETSPFAAGAAQLGHGLEEAGRAAETVSAYRMMAQHKLNATVADADFNSKAIDLGEQIKTETDPAKVAALGALYQDAAAHAAQAFADPDAARLWATRQQAAVAAGQAGAAARVTELQRQNYNATIRGQIDEQARTGAAASDPTAMPLALNSIGRLSDAAVQAGAMTPVEGYAARKAATQQLVTGRAETLTNAGQPDAAMALLDQHVGDLDPHIYEGARFRAQQTQQRLAIKGATDDLWNRFGGADAESGAGGMLPQRIAAAATGAGVDPVTALTTAQIESGMGRNLGSRGNVFQLGEPEWQAAGGGDFGDLPTQIKNGVAHLASIAPQLADALGRDPAPADLYLGHQQGVAGAASLLQHPDQNAIAAVRQFYPSGAKGDALARQAILANGGTEDMSAGDFAAKWQHTFDTTAQRFGAYAARGDEDQSSDAATGAADMPQGIGQAGLRAPLAQRQAATAGGPAPMPDLNGMLAQVQGRVDSGEFTPDQGDAIAAGLSARFHRLAAVQATQRAQLATRLNDGAAQLKAGGQFDYDPAEIRHYLPPDQADAAIQTLDDAKQLGQAATIVRNASPDQIDARRARLSTGLDQPNAPDFARRSAMLGAFDRAVQDRNQKLAADPAQYLIDNDPTIKAASASVDSFQDYATATLAQEARLGLSDLQQHVLAKSGAVKLAAALNSNPAGAPATLQRMQAQWGGAWPKVWHDMVTLGGLPPAYEAVGTLQSPQNASLLARALSEPNDIGKSLADRVGPQPYNQMKQYIRGNQDDLPLYLNSLQSQWGMSGAKVDQVLDTIDTLAAARATYLHEPLTTAADNAIQAFTGQYSFDLPGNPAVPVDKAAAVSANAAATLAGLTTDNIAMPRTFGASPALPSRQDFIDQLHASPNWVTAPTGDALWLLDSARNVVSDSNGRPIAVPFDAPAPAGPATAAPPPPNAAEPGDAGSYGEGQQ